MIELQKQMNLEPSPLMEMSEGDLINLNVGDDVRYEVLAVPGGWLYTRMAKSPIVGGGETCEGMCFVPRPSFTGIDLGTPVTPVGQPDADKTEGE